jgi:glycerol-3-phosphate dehydrogenase
VAPEGREPFDISARVVVNAAGVWSDQVRALDEHRDPHSIRPAKGIHITVPNRAFPCDIAAVIPVKEDRRSIFVVSWGDQVYLGTTDTEWDSPLDDPSCEPEDIDYILNAANAITTQPIGRGDITGLWTGLRPLLAPLPGKNAPSERTADLSRRHTVRTSSSGVVTVTGGKLTTYRKMAEDTVDAVVGALGRRSLHCVTKDLRLRGAGTEGSGPALSATPSGAEAHPRPDQATAVATHLAGRYGTETPDVLAMAEGRPELLEPLVEGLHYLAVEALYAVREEMAGSVADVLDRRTRASLRDARAAADASHRVAELIGPELGWDRSRVDHEAAVYAKARRDELARAGLESGPRPERTGPVTTARTVVAGPSETG